MYIFLYSNRKKIKYVFKCSMKGEVLFVVVLVFGELFREVLVLFDFYEIYVDYL